MNYLKKLKIKKSFIWLIFISFLIGLVFGMNSHTKHNEPIQERVQIINSTPENTVVYSGKYTLTAYCPCNSCCGKSDKITATGTIATAGRTVAVDPNVIPYGTKVIIDGHTYIAEDCGGAIKNNKIDIFFDTHEEALDFGKRQEFVYIVKGSDDI